MMHNKSKVKHSTEKITIPKYATFTILPLSHHSFLKPSLPDNGDPLKDEVPAMSESPSSESPSSESPSSESHSVISLCANNNPRYQIRQKRVPLIMNMTLKPKATLGISTRRLKRKVFACHAGLEKLLAGISLVFYATMQ